MNKNNVPEKFSAGASMVDITPCLGTVINGNFLPTYAKSIHDPLFVKALAFHDSHHRFVFVVVDSMSLDGRLIEETKQLISRQTGLRNDELMIAANHAHSCGAVEGGSIAPADLAYRLAMPEKICLAVQQALDCLQPAAITWGRAELPQHASCRRWFMLPGFVMESPFGDEDKVWMNPPLGSEFLHAPVSVVDPQLCYLGIKSLQGNWISILANYSIHYAADIPEHTISADYFGEVHRQLKLKLGADENFVGIMTNGTSGDVNTFDFRLERDYPQAPYAKSVLIANDVTDAIIDNLRQAKFDANPVFSSNAAWVEAQTRQPQKSLVEKSKQMIAALDYSALVSIDKDSDTIRNAYAIDIVELAAYQKDSIQLPIQAIRIGEGTIGTLPGEFFSATGLALKASADAPNYFTICLANANEGYMPPEEEFALGGYETWLCKSSHMEVGAEKKLRKNLAQLIEQLQ
jgi:neutral ceramidase